MKQRIQQEITVAAPPARVYQLLTEADEFSKLSGGAPTEIDATPGGAFSCFGGMIQGRNLECVPSQRLVQAWRAKTWAEGVYSVVAFRLAPDGHGTKIAFEHTGFPEDQGEHLEKGWQANYWEPLQRLVA